MVYKLKKDIVKKYYKYQSWTQPTLTANGTIGGSSFAAYASSEYNSGSRAYFAFNSDSSQYWHSNNGHPQWIGWYNPNPLRVTNIKVQNRNSDGSYIKNYTILCSNDNNNFIEVASGTSPNQSAYAEWNIAISETNSYKYWRLNCTSSSGSNSSYTAVQYITITATEMVSGTSSDYDFYEDIITYKMLTESVRKYYKYTNIPNCEAVGSPSISNGVISSFTTSNYYQINNMVGNYEYVIKIKTPSNITTTCTFFNSYHFLTVDMENGIISSYKSKDETRQTIVSCSANTWYWIKIRVSGHTKICSYSTNGTDYTQVIVFTDTSTTISGTPLRFGVGVDSTYSDTSKTWITEQLCRGEIDLKECYIKDYGNNKIVWRGMQYNKSTSSDYNFYEDVNVYKALKQ